LNRRTAPQLYLDVLPVIGTPDAPRFGEAGDAAQRAIDWVLRMHRFDDGALLDSMAHAGTLTPTRRCAGSRWPLPRPPAAPPSSAHPRRRDAGARRAGGQPQPLGAARASPRCPVVRAGSSGARRCS
jgi:hypothetical protein